MITVLRCGTVLTARTHDTTLSNVAIVVSDDRIMDVVAAEKYNSYPDAQVLDLRDRVVIPGFVQTHIHLCQTLFRGLADDLELLDWLQQRIFPYEAAHDQHSIHSSALVGILELIRSGTTTILDMGTIHFEEEIIRAVGESGMRAHVGKAMMDLNDAYPRLRESTRDALTTTRDLAERWHNSFEGRISYAAAPRFVLSCSDTLLREVGEMVCSSTGMLLHTHASENLAEVNAVRSRCGMDNIAFLHRMGMLSPKTCLAHCVHVTDQEVGLLSQTRTNVAHCPSSNLKLASGIAPIPRFLESGINVSLGADGAPCNNRLDMFQEMRIASLLQKPKHGPTSMDCGTIFRMATLGGAKALGLDREIGTIESGKKADLVVLDLHKTGNPLSDQHPHSSVVYSGCADNVESVMINGRWVYRNRTFVDLDEERILHDARNQLRRLLDRLQAN